MTCVMCPGILSEIPFLLFVLVLAGFCCNQECQVNIEGWLFVYERLNSGFLIKLVNLKENNPRLFIGNFVLKLKLQ